MVKEKWLSGKLLVDANSENIDFLKTLVFLEIRHLEGLRDHIGLYGNKLYMVVIMQGKDDGLLQTFFRNSESLVQKQICVYRDWWKIAIPLSSRTKELEHQHNDGYDKSLFGIRNIQNEINSLVGQTKQS